PLFSPNDHCRTAMNTTETHKLQLETSGGAELEQLNGQLGLTETTIGELAVALGRGEIGISTFNDQVELATATATNLRTAIAALEQATREQAVAQRAAEQAAEDQAAKARALAAAEQAGKDAVEAATAAIERLTAARRAEAAAGGSKAQLTAEEQRFAAAIEHETAATRDSATAAARLQTVLDAVQREALETAAAFARGEIDVKEFTQQLQLLDHVATQTRTELAGVAKAQTSAGEASDRSRKRLDDHDKASKTATGSTRNLGLGFLELSRAVEDAQYGLNGVLNDLPTMVSMFGGPAGLAAVVSLTAVGA